MIQSFGDKEDNKGIKRREYKTANTGDKVEAIDALAKKHGKNWMKD